MTETPPAPGSYALPTSAQTPHEGRLAHSRSTSRKESGWTGWLTFASTMIGIVGVFQIANVGY